MKLLLDTHALLWWWTDDLQLSGAAREAIADEGNTVLVSAASVWEISTKDAARNNFPDLIKIWRCPMVF